jgi:hypothetical protein
MSEKVNLYLETKKWRGGKARRRRGEEVAGRRCGNETEERGGGA